MSSKGPTRLPSTPKLPGRRRPPTRLPSNVDNKTLPRRASLTSGGPKAQRTSKTSQKLVVLPSAPQTKQLLAEIDEDLTLGHETDGGVREYKSQAERMSKEQREHAGFKRITAYCVAEGFKTKHLASFLKREHNVVPRVFDEAIYTMYHLPLLTGYGPDTNIRSSVPAKARAGKSLLSRLSEAEENGYQGSYFSSPVRRHSNELEGYVSSSSPIYTRKPLPTTSHTAVTPSSSETELEQHNTPPHAPARRHSNELDYVLPSSLTDSRKPLLPTASTSVDRELFAPSETDMPISSETELEQDSMQYPAPAFYESEMEGSPQRQVHWQTPPRTKSPDAELAEVVFFEYGVAVFFGLEERQERDILEDIDRAGILKRPFEEDDWEIEECHFTHDPNIAYPRIYNDFFTLKSRSHLLKLSIAHALAQSTLLARYETTAQRVLSSPVARSIPAQLAASGKLQMRRRDALMFTGRLFKLRRDVNLVSNVLDVPELFWAEASLGALYEAVREYMEIKGRVQVLNEKLGIASDFLDAIHDHLNNNEMTRITWIVIWLIVIAVVVELGEIIARLVMHATLRGGGGTAVSSVLAKEDALRVLHRMMQSP